MVSASLAIVVFILVLGQKTRRPSITGATRKANLTFFDDAELMGIQTSAYPLKFQGRNVWPAAVHQRDFSAHAHKVLEVFLGDKTFLVHVADMCNANDSPCKTNPHANGNPNFLIDIHKSGWHVTGQTTGILPVTFRVVGSIPAHTIPIAHQNATIFCGCADATCDPNKATWCPRGKCHLASKCWA
jgi:hypothetical protein